MSELSITGAKHAVNLLKPSIGTMEFNLSGSLLKGLLTPLIQREDLSNIALILLYQDLDLPVSSL